MEISYGRGVPLRQLNSGKENTSAAGTAVALGFFDGVHEGHRALLRELKTLSEKEGLKSVVYTFVNHPAEALGKEVKLLCSNRQKAAYISEEGADQLVFDWFDEEFSRMPPEQFVRDVLAGYLNARIVVAGENYTFGFKGSGNVRLLSELGERYGFKTVIIPRIETVTGGNRVTVSSSLLRELIARGQLREYAKLTGHPFVIEGIVRNGREVGRKIGFPTANIKPDRRLALPERGVYATLTRISSEPGASYKSITNIGINPTFTDAGGVSIETNILDFEGDLYGRTITVEVLEKMRDEFHFPDPDALRKQIASDAEKRRHII